MSDSVAEYYMTRCEKYQERIAELERKAGAEGMEAAKVRSALATRDKEYQLEHDLRVELEQKLKIAKIE